MVNSANVVKYSDGRLTIPVSNFHFIFDKTDIVNYANVVSSLKYGFLTTERLVHYPYRIFVIIKMEKIMKTKSIYLVALLLSAVTVFGKDEPKKAGVAVLPVKGAEVFKVIYQNETLTKVKVNLYNSKSEIVYSESFYNTQGFILPLNFSNLSYGVYKVELIDANGKSQEEIVYQPTKRFDNVRVAKIENTEGKFLISVMSAKKEQLTVKIFDNFNNLLHNEVKNIDGNFAQVYKIENLKGACTFEISDAAGHSKTVQF